MTNEELDREIERAARNAKKVASLAAENERTARDVAAVLSPSTETSPTRHAPRNPYAVRG
jgi:hypothetical protein